MDRGVYVAMAGAREAFVSQETHANNLANISTVGFKADFEQLRSMPTYGDGDPTRVYVMSERPGTNTRPGVMMTTGRSLDVAIKGEGWFTVLDKDGQEAYTRAGNFERDPNGVLTVGDGYKVVGSGGPITVPAFENLEVGTDGGISLRALGEGPLGIVQVDRLRLVKPAKPESMVKGPDGLFRMKGGERAPEDPTIQVQSGALEGSNVSAVGELTAILQSARIMEMNVKMMAAFKENDQAAARSMQS